MNDQQIFALKSNLSNFILSLPKNGTPEIVKFIWAEGMDMSGEFVEKIGRRFGHWVLQVGDSFYYYLTYEYSDTDRDGVRVENLEFKRNLVENLYQPTQKVISLDKEPIVMGTTNRLSSNQILLIGKSLLMNFDKYQGYWDSITFLQILIELITVRRCLRIDIPIGGIFRIDHDFYSSLKIDSISEEFREILKHSANVKGVDFETIVRKRKPQCIIS